MTDGSVKTGTGTNWSFAAAGRYLTFVDLGMSSLCETFVPERPRRSAHCKSGFGFSSRLPPEFDGEKQFVAAGSIRHPVTRRILMDELGLEHVQDFCQFLDGVVRPGGSVNHRLKRVERRTR